MRTVRETERGFNSSVYTTLAVTTATSVSPGCFRQPQKCSFRRCWNSAKNERMLV